MKKRVIQMAVLCLLSATQAQAGSAIDSVKDREWCRDPYPQYPLLKRLLPDDCVKSETHNNYTS